jgi:hypothetical protein
LWQAPEIDETIQNLLPGLFSQEVGSD